MHSLSRPAAVAFDLDGTLIDTEPTLLEAQHRTLAAFGICELAPDHPRTFAMGMVPGVTRLCEFYGLAYRRALEVFKPTWNHLAATEPTPTPGARALLGRFSAAGLPMALVTSADRGHARNSLAALGLRKAFECVVDAETVSRLKPSPEPYVTAAERLGVEPADVVGIEDSGSGVASVLAAGMVCVAVHATVHDQPEMALAHIKIRSLKEFPPFT